MLVWSCHSPNNIKMLFDSSDFIVVDVIFCRRLCVCCLFCSKPISLHWYQWRNSVLAELKFELNSKLLKCEIGTTKSIVLLTTKMMRDQLKLDVHNWNHLNYFWNVWMDLFVLQIDLPKVIQLKCKIIEFVYFGSNSYKLIC